MKIRKQLIENHAQITALHRRLFDFHAGDLLVCVLNHYECPAISIFDPSVESHPSATFDIGSDGHRVRECDAGFAHRLDEAKALLERILESDVEIQGAAA